MTTLPFLALLSGHASEVLQFLYHILFLKSLLSSLAAKAKVASLGSSFSFFIQNQDGSHSVPEPMLSHLPFAFSSPSSSSRGGGGRGRV